MFGKFSIEVLETKAELAKALCREGDHRRVNKRVKKIMNFLIVSSNPKVQLVLEETEQFFGGRIRLEYL